jgi:hypothetical protein
MGAGARERWATATADLTAQARAGVPIKFGSHGRFRRVARGVTFDQVLTVLTTGRVTGERPGRQGDTVWEMEGEVERAEDGRPGRLRVAVIREPHRLFVVTTMWRTR